MGDGECVDSRNWCVAVFRFRASVGGGGGDHGIWGSEFEGTSIGIPIGIPRMGNLGGREHF